MMHKKVLKFLYDKVDLALLASDYVFRRHAVTPAWADATYRSLFSRGLRLDGSPCFGRDKRFWHLVQFLKATSHLTGETAEAGCLFGLSSFLMCSYEQLAKPEYLGETHQIFDSFMGFRDISEHDIGRDSHNGIKIANKMNRVLELNQCFINRTRTTLADFPKVRYHQGWIPELFEGVERKTYRFVHIDLDLYEPIRAALEFFFPQLVQSGIIVVDDYGFRTWPGAKDAVDEWCQESGQQVVPLITGNAVVIKR